MTTRAAPVGATSATTEVVPDAPRKSSPEHPRLSEAENAVVSLVLEDRSSASIAEARGVSRRTIENQIASIFRKLGCRSRAELAAIFAAR